ncbi:peptidylprolyl isomerase [Oleiharenicola lentus]|uniref:peptidylprolyl isomerase n=1 Tax=Oleiharenicola lentus TaxID=2508720 RepID=UPI003F66F25E
MNSFPRCFILRFCFTSALALAIGVLARATTPALTQTLPAQTLEPGGASLSVDLRNYFGLPGVTGQLVQFDTVLGKFNVELRADSAPVSVANFLSYVNSGAYTNTFFHRSVPGFILQGGGYYAVTNVPSVPASTPIALEYNLPNQRGTIAMARTNELNSATTQWFINTVDNTTNLGQANAGGYAVFGRVIGSGMSVVDAIVALPRYNIGSPFDTLPTRNVQNNQIYLENLVTLPSVTTIATYPAGGSSVLAFSVDNSNPAVVTATLSESMLNLAATAASGSATITVTATDTNGNTATGSFEVTVAAVVLAQTIDFAELSPRTFGDAAFTVSATASSGLPVAFSIASGPATISGNTVTITGSGSVVVRASQAGSSGYLAAPDVERTFQVDRATAAISISGLAFTYDGAPKSATVTTSPAGLAVAITYDGAGTPPTNAGSYAVLAVVNDANYAQSSSATLVIAKAGQTIAFPGPANQPFSTTAIPLSATASSGLPVTFSLVSGPATLVGNALSLTGAGLVTLRASQFGDENRDAAPEVEHAFVVAGNFASWQIEKFTSAELLDVNLSGPNAVYGADGLSNLVKYALGLEPKSNVTSGLPEISTTSTQWIYTYTRPAGRADVTYAVEISTNLSAWTTTGVTHVLVNSAGGVETWHASHPLSGAANAFFRLKVFR